MDATNKNQIKYSKKALMWSTVGRWIFVVALLLVLLIVIGMLTGNLSKAFDGIKQAMRFGP